MIFRVLLLLLDIVDRLEDFFMKINWIARIKNKSFWLALIPAVLLLVQTVAAVFGFTPGFRGAGQPAAGRGQRGVCRAGHPGRCHRPHYQGVWRQQAGPYLRQAEGG